MTDDGTWGDYWLYEDRLIYVHKRHVAIPLDATPDGDVARFDRSKMYIAALTYDEMRPGCYEPKARIDDLALAGVDGSLAVPDVPAVLRADVHGGQRPRARAGVRPGLQRLDDRGLVRATPTVTSSRCASSRCGTSSSRSPRSQRNAARGARAICFSEIPTHLGLPSIHTGYWDPLFAVCEETRTALCMHIGSSSKMPSASPDAPPSTDIMLSCNNSMASLADFLFSGVLVRFPELKLAYSEGQIGWIPYALERADNTWEYHSNWTKAKETIPEPPSTYYQGRIFGCFTNDVHGVESHRRGRRGQHLLRDRLPAHRHDVAVRRARRRRG